MHDHVHSIVRHLDARTDADPTAALIAALAPFAAAAARVDATPGGPWDDADELEIEGWGVGVTVGDLRRAAEVLGRTDR